MNFDSKKAFLNYLNRLPKIGVGSEGMCYLDIKNNKVYKIFHQALEDIDEDYIPYSEKEILKFSHIKNNTFVFPEKVITLKGEIVGYTAEYIRENSLYQINPLKINLDKFSESLKNTKNDIALISEKNILTYDIMYNILYGKDGFKIIDTLDYNYSLLDTDEIYKNNIRNFNYEVLFFLVDGYFDELVSHNILLNSLYSDKDVDIIEFLNNFRKVLSEIENKRVSNLSSCKKCLNKKLIRNIYYDRSYRR